MDPSFVALRATTEGKGGRRCTPMEDTGNLCVSAFICGSPFFSAVSRYSAKQRFAAKHEL